MTTAEEAGDPIPGFGDAGMQSEDLVVTQPNSMSDKTSKSIVSRPGSELTRTRPGAAVIIDRMIDDMTDIIRRRDVVQRVSGDHEVGGADYRSSDEGGGASAQSLRGGKFRSREDVPEDDADAAKWYRRAAEQGDADAQYRLGEMYFHGTGVPEDEAEAAKWYRRAAEQGHAFAQSSLGDMYRYGWGVPQDGVEAVAWYRCAAEQNHASLSPISEHVSASCTRDGDRRAAEQLRSEARHELWFQPRRRAGLSRVTRPLSQISETCTATAAVFPRMASRRWRGTDARPSRIMLPQNSPESCLGEMLPTTSMATGFRLPTTPRR